MFYHPAPNNNNNNSNPNHDDDKIDLEKTARLCWLDMFSNQTLDNIHAICLFCNQLSFEPITTFLYSQPYDDKIHRQNISLCWKCLKDFEDYQVGFIAREQHALDQYDYEHGIATAELQNKKPKLSLGDYDMIALQDITHVCISKLCDKAEVVRTFEPILTSLDLNNHRMMFKNNEFDSLTSFDRIKIKDVCSRDEQPLNIYQICKELFISNADVRHFFYYRKQNIDSRFKLLWPLRYKIQELTGE